MSVSRSQPSSKWRVPARDAGSTQQYNGSTRSASAGRRMKMNANCQDMRGAAGELTCRKYAPKDRAAKRQMAATAA